MKERREEYYLDPVLCKQCQAILSYEEASSKIFCNSSCAATYNNSGRIRTEESKVKTSQSVISYYDIEGNRKLYCNVSWCKVCNIIIRNSQNKTCSVECYMIQHRENGRKGGKKTASLGLRRSKDEIKLAQLCSEQFIGVEFNTIVEDGWDSDIVLRYHKVAIAWNGAWHYKDKIVPNHSLKQILARDEYKKRLFEKHGWRVLIYDDRYFTPESAFEHLKSVLEI